MYFERHIHQFQVFEITTCEYLVLGPYLAGCEWRIEYVVL